MAGPLMEEDEQELLVEQASTRLNKRRQRRKSVCHKAMSQVSLSATAAPQLAATKDSHNVLF